MANLIESLGDYINGEFIRGVGELFSSHNPARSGVEVAQMVERAEAVDQAVSSAKRALKSWRSGGLEHRIEALKAVAALVPEHQERIAEAICLEMGKPIAEARVEAGSIKSKIEGVIQQLDQTLPSAPSGAPGEQRFHALGVIAVIGPFNFPVHLLNTHIIPALLTGNTIIAKPSEVTPLCGQRYAELFHAARFPTGVFNLIQGRGATGAKLSAHPQVNGVIFTGSYETGRKIRQATFDQPYKKVCLELGGKNPAVVLDDADLDQATREILLGSLLTTGQRCTATSRVIASSGIAVELKNRLVDAFKRIRPLDPLDDSCFMGPLATENAKDRFLKLLALAKSQGAEPWVESEGIAGGAFVTPSIYGVQGTEDYLDHELFGPHISFQIVADDQAALEAASQNQYGLSASLFTQREEMFEAFYDEVSAGVLNWNRSTNGASGLLPFGGIGKSGNWHAAGSEGPRLSTYPVAVMSVPYAQVTPNKDLERQLLRHPLGRLERQHRLEELGERFGLWFTVDGLDLRLPFTQISIREGGAALSNEVLAEIAFEHDLKADTFGLLFSLREEDREETAELEEKLLSFLNQLLEIDPEPFLARPKREILSPIDGEMPRSATWLERFYGGEFLPREKKSAVVDLARSQGPFLRSVDESPLQIMDAASQIASLPAGFRPDAAQLDLDDGRYDEVMISSPHPGELGAEVFEQYKDDLLAFAPPGVHHLCWTNGGAESNEKAFHLAKIHGPGGHRVLAFDSSFHGRTLLALFCTYNPAKRTLYQIKGHEAVFLERPIPKSPYADPEVSSEWISAWSDPNGDRAAQRERHLSSFISKPSDHVEDGIPLLEAEIKALIALEDEIKSGEVLTCIIEPYQCEGGDVSPTRRFFNGLRALTRAYQVPLIFDEVQSGFGLSGPIFWHSNFDLKNAAGETDGPDLIVCAKRAQVGLVLSRWPDPDPGPSHAASAARGRAHLRLLQSIPSHETLLRERLADLTKRWSRLVLRPRAFGDAFGFDLPTPEIAMHLIAQRFYRGYMVYIAGQKTLRYRMNRGYTEREIHEVFRVIERSLEALTEQAGGEGEDLIERMTLCKPPQWVNSDQVSDPNYQVSLTEALTVPGDADLYLKRHGELSRARRVSGEICLGLQSRPSEADLKTLSEAEPARFSRATGYSLTHFVADRIGTRIRRVSLDEFDAIIDQVVELEENAYELARRDDIKTLREIAAHPEGIVCVAENLDGLVGMAFASPLEEWSHIEGPNRDAHLGKGDTLYSADITVDVTVRGQGIGHRLRKEVIHQAVLAKREDGAPRYYFITGRNRVGNANAMWAVNQRWGAYLVEEMEGQYGESEGRSRYYRIPLRRADRRQSPMVLEREHLFENGERALMWGVHQPTDGQHPLLKHARDLGVFDEGMLTKLTVSNFITPAYARYAEAMRAITPPGCAHMYFTSCLDEMIDKSIRSLKHNRPGAHVVVGFEGTRIGGNTAAGRSLSECEKHFDWPTLPHPNLDPKATITALDQLCDELGGPEFLIGVYLEAIQSVTGTVLTDDAWEALCAWRDRSGVPLVLSEVASGFGRSGRGFWWLSAAQSEADIVLWWAGGQIGHIFCRPRVFVSTPLTLISTWDGDELSATRLLWQLYATREGLAERVQMLSGQLEEILTQHFSKESLSGAGLYRTIKSAHAAALYQALQEEGVQIQRLGDHLCIAPPLSSAIEDLELFAARLKNALSRLA